jgi:hypothetical protein
MRYAGAARLLSGGRRTRRKAAPAKRRKQKLVSDKIRVLRNEGTPQKQAVATALSMQRAGRLRPGGVYVPAKKSK